jgi:hypothetical protein
MDTARLRPHSGQALTRFRAGAETTTVSSLSRGNLGEKSGDQDENWVPLSGVMIVAVAVTRKRFLAL